MGLKNKKKIIVVIITLIVSISTVSYALWTTTHIQTGQNSINVGCLDIQFTEGDGINITNGYPITDEAGKKSKGTEFSITNTCTVPVAYEVVLDEITTTLADNNLKINVSGSREIEPVLLSEMSETNPVPLSDQEVSSARSILKDVVPGAEASGQTGGKKTYVLRLWINQDITENLGSGKEFNGRIAIRANQINKTDKTLVNNIIANNPIQTETPDFSKGEPLGEDCSQNITEDKTVSLSSSTSYFVGDTFEYSNNDNGQYIIKNDGIKVAQGVNTVYSDTDKDKYMCRSFNPCTTMYKIKEISKDKKSIIKADEYTSTCKSETQGSGVYKAEDNEGESYYFRGNIENNYVKFADMLWRIIRINGDGSVRLILNERVGPSPFNIISDNEKYVGYTYDNNTSCTKEKPCKVNYENGIFINENGGQNSTIKTYLETWYKDKLNDYDDKIATSYFCNDTSYGSGNENTWIYFNAVERLRRNEVKPTIKCPNPTKQDGSLRDYGGIYKTKIGLLTADEAVIAGIGGGTNAFYSTRTNYLGIKQHNISLTPFSTWKNYGSLFFMSFGGMFEYGAGANEYFYPVINIESNAIATGIGTIDNPYVVK